VVKVTPTCAYGTVTIVLGVISSHLCLLCLFDAIILYAVVEISIPNVVPEILILTCCMISPVILHVIWLADSISLLRRRLQCGSGKMFWPTRIGSVLEFGQSANTSFFGRDKSNRVSTILSQFETDQSPRKTYHVLVVLSLLSLV